MAPERLSPPDPTPARLSIFDRDTWEEYLALRAQGYSEIQLQTLALLQIASMQSQR